MSKINTHHTTSLYEECFAKLLLEQIENKIYSLRDKPDLVCGDVGVEVVSAFPDGYKQSIQMMADSKIIKGKLSDMGYCNNETCPGILFHPTKVVENENPFPALNYIINTLNNKKSKIINYSRFKDLNLFIITDNLDFRNNIIECLVNKIIYENESIFKKIYLQYCDKIIIIDCQRRYFQKKTIIDI